eukprot:TRINITY_DN32249_c0_g1_i1.p1 TRINITY_DN32249_c0_g1~~TRINITY_DN32249_c0_g1_i1.p1  ORF type:complete len:1194 (+),score=357.44 TRINITY_DN32249_c0_g1_i1:213-3584(+)
MPCWIAVFATQWYTAINLSPGEVALVVTLSKCIDVLSDPMMACYLRKCSMHKICKIAVIGSLIQGAAFALLFLPFKPIDASRGRVLLQFAACYIMFFVGDTLVGTPVTTLGTMLKSQEVLNEKHHNDGLRFGSMCKVAGILAMGGLTYVVSSLVDAAGGEMGKADGVTAGLTPRSNFYCGMLFGLSHFIIHLVLYLRLVTGVLPGRRIRDSTVDPLVLRDMSITPFLTQFAEMMTSSYNNPFFRQLIGGWVCDQLAITLLKNLLMWYVRHKVEPEIGYGCHAYYDANNSAYVVDEGFESAIEKRSFECKSTNVASIGVFFVIVGAIIGNFLWQKKLVGEYDAYGNRNLHRNWLLFNLSSALTNGLFVFVGRGDNRLFWVLCLFNGIPFGGEFMTDSILLFLIASETWLSRSDKALGEADLATAFDSHTTKFSMMKTFLPKAVSLVAEALPLALIQIWYRDPRNICRDADPPLDITSVECAEFLSYNVSGSPPKYIPQPPQVRELISFFFFMLPTLTCLVSYHIKSGFQVTDSAEMEMLRAVRYGVPPDRRRESLGPSPPAPPAVPVTKQVRFTEVISVDARILARVCWLRSFGVGFMLFMVAWIAAALAVGGTDLVQGAWSVLVTVPLFLMALGLVIALYFHGLFDLRNKALEDGDRERGTGVAMSEPPTCNPIPGTFGEVPPPSMLSSGGAGAADLSGGMKTREAMIEDARGAGDVVALQHVVATKTFSKPLKDSWVGRLIPTTHGQHLFRLPYFPHPFSRVPLFVLRSACRHPPEPTALPWVYSGDDDSTGGFLSVAGIKGGLCGFFALLTPLFLLVRGLYRLPSRMCTKTRVKLELSGCQSLADVSARTGIRFVDGTVRVRDVTAGTPAEEAGVAVGWALTRVGTERVRGTAEADRLLRVAVSSGTGPVTIRFAAGRRLPSLYSFGVAGGRSMDTLLGSVLPFLVPSRDGQPVPPPSAASVSLEAPYHPAPGSPGMDVPQMVLDPGRTTDATGLFAIAAAHYNAYVAASSCPLLFSSQPRRGSKEELLLALELGARTASEHGRGYVVFVPASRQGEFEGRTAEANADLRQRGVSVSRLASPSSYPFLCYLYQWTEVRPAEDPDVGQNGDRLPLNLNEGAE